MGPPLGLNKFQSEKGIRKEDHTNILTKKHLHSNIKGPPLLGAFRLLTRGQFEPMEPFWEAHFFSPDILVLFFSSQY